MLFTSFSFLFAFLPIVYLGFLLISRFNQVKITSIWLLLASIVFYIIWNPKDLLLLSISILSNYFFYLGIIKNTGSVSRYLLYVGIAFNLLLLGYYKYFDFFITELLSQNIPKNTYLVPLGISFYTFTQISFLVDCYKKKYEQNDLINYFLFVTYFPHLVCGPILSFKTLYPQLSNPIKFKPSLQNLSLFIFCFSIGVFKKTVLGDYLGEFANRIFDAEAAAIFDFQTSVLGTLCYSMQLYFDFSGYSDMAIGLSYLFGLKIPYNFNAPYQATSIINFWKRWHISLSDFLKDYVYIPLGGNRGSFFTHYRNLWITMLVGGLWHGASWTFIIWGAYYAALLSLNHLCRNINFKWISLPVKLVTLFKISFTFIFVSLGWVLFRSATVLQALNIYKGILGLNEGLRLSFWQPALGLVFLSSLAIAFICPDTITLKEKLFFSHDKKNTVYVNSAAFLCGIIAILGVLCFTKVQHFLYSGF